MRMFMLKSFCIVALMFISVLAGMQMAHEGIHEIKGNNDSNLTIKAPNVNTSLLGNDSSSHDIIAKQQKLEKMNAFNLFSSMGKKLSDGISNSSEKIIRSIAK